MPSRPMQPVALKQKVLLSLTRLGDRDTQRVAVAELTDTIATISPDHIGVLLGCLCDDAAAAPKASARKEALRLLETLTKAHGEHALPHVPRMVSALARRFKDPDSNVADACVDAMGTLAEYTVSSRPSLNFGGGIHSGKSVMAGPEALGPLFVRPILDVIHETNSRAAQDTACRALARVFRRCGPGPGAADIPVGTNWYPEGGPGRLALRLARMLEAQTFYAKPALLHAIAALFNAAAPALMPQLPSLLGVAEPSPSGSSAAAAAAAAAASSARLLDALRSADWPVRRSAAEALTVLMYALGPTLDTGPTPLVPLIEARLAEARFDKVKPARDAVGESLAVVKEELQEYDGPQHDVVRWRTWVRHKLGDRVGAVRGDLGGGGGGGGGVGGSPKATRGHALGAGSRARTPPPRHSERENTGHYVSSSGQGQGQASYSAAHHPRGTNGGGGGGGGRRALSEAFREAHISGHDAVLVPSSPPPPFVAGGRLTNREDEEERHHHQQQHHQQPSGVSVGGTVGGTTAGGTGGEQEQDDDAHDARRRDGEFGRGPGAGGGGDIIIGAGNGNDGVHLGDRITGDGNVVNGGGGLVDFELGEEAPAWVSLAAQLENQLDLELERSNRRLGLSDEAGGVAAVADSRGVGVVAAARVGVGGGGLGLANRDGSGVQKNDATDKGSGGIAGGGGAMRASNTDDDDTGNGNGNGNGSGGGGGADADVRRQLGQLAVAQAQVLERLGVFVAESTAAIATLTQRVDALEGTVGAAVTASASAAASAAALADGDRRRRREEEDRGANSEGAEGIAAAAKSLADDRAALEIEKAQLREAAAQLERAAAQLEQAVPGAPGGGGFVDER